MNLPYIPPIILLAGIYLCGIAAAIFENETKLVLGVFIGLMPYTCIAIHEAIQESAENAEDI